MDILIEEESRIRKKDIEADVFISRRDMFAFNMYDTYTTSKGPVSIFLGAAVFLVAYLTAGSIGAFYTVLYLICAVIFIIYYPILMYVKSGVQVKNSVILTKPLHFVFSDEGLTVSTDVIEIDNVAEVSWKDVWKVRETGRELFIYTGKSDAYILPKEQISLPLMKIKRLISTNVGSGKVRLKKTR